MTTAEILERLESDYPEVLRADGLDDAILGVVDGWFPTGDGHHSQRSVVCYDYSKCVELMVAQGMDDEEANEWLQYNTIGAYAGQYTPVFLYNWREQ